MASRTDLTTVEEIETQIVIEDAPHTPPRLEAEAPVPHRSPGAISEMSGTTAISSFSMVEAEMLEPRFIVRHLPKLFEALKEFLNHLVPDNGQLEDDHQNIIEMQMPDSDFNADYRDFDAEVTLRLNHFRGEHEQYIHLRAIHRALFGPNRDSAAARCCLDPVLYMANLLIFAKQMMRSDRSEKEIWNALRELDNFFPARFLPALILGTNASESPTGDSALLQETFELALDLRTQLAILVLERASNDSNFNPDEALDEVFFQSKSPQAGAGSVIRGWSVSALGGEDSVLPQAFQGKVVERFSQMREFFPTDAESLERGDVADLDGLGSNFPWNSVILRLLGWVRLRNRELQAAIHNHGGISAIVERVKAEMQNASANEARATSVPQPSPRKKRTSFGRGRRRSSRKFDPNADVDDRVVDKLIARERRSAVEPAAESSQQMQQQPEEEGGEEAVVGLNEQDDWHMLPEDDQQPTVEPIEEPPEEAAGPSGPPQSTVEILRLLKEGKKLDKENRGVSLFQRQATAQRVEFGDGFDETQPTPGPSRSKGKQRQQSSPRKRRRAAEESSEDEEAFEHEQRTAKVQERREKAKRVRIDPSSSGAPTSHQPRARNENEDEEFQPQEQEVSPSETKAPEMTEPAPSSTFSDQKQLARVNIRAKAKPRKARTGWTAEAEEALVEYMEKFPQRYAQILAHDAASGRPLLRDRTQVNLKDKARNMAITMIK